MDGSSTLLEGIARGQLQNPGLLVAHNHDAWIVYDGSCARCTAERALVTAAQAFQVALAAEAP